MHLSAFFYDGFILFMLVVFYDDYILLMIIIIIKYYAYYDYHITILHFVPLRNQTSPDIRTRQDTIWF